MSMGLESRGRHTIEKENAVHDSNYEQQYEYSSRLYMYEYTISYLVVDRTRLLEVFEN